MNKKIIATGAAFGAIAIILGAFGAHALKKVLTVEELSTFETGVKYQMYHALFLLFVGLMGFISEKTKATIFYLITTGVVLFSGSIYILATKSLSGIDLKIIGIATPVGGFLLILGWICLFVNILRQKS
ncbi:DUF423 domain-containing protein [Flavobacterium sp. 3HN19-14]|uniref:DUF423 domain-containing protein n=1 Tax=Flavobacterium sp. 3HN19-14 TaxID=3448133 RepID=UPI003EE2D297